METYFQPRLYFQGGSAMLNFTVASCSGILRLWTVILRAITFTLFFILS